MIPAGARPQVWPMSEFRIDGQSKYQRYQGSVTALDAIDAANAFMAEYRDVKFLVVTLIEPLSTDA